MEMYNGWLIVNSYYNPAKFNSLYKLLQESAEKAGLRFSKWTSDQRPTIVGSIAKEPKPEFVLFWDKDIQLAKTMELSGLKLFSSSSAFVKMILPNSFSKSFRNGELRSVSVQRFSYSISSGSAEFQKFFSAS